MNICIITSSFPSYPKDMVQAPFTIDFIGGLKRRGHQVFIYTQDRRGVKEEWIEGVKIKRFSWKGAEKPIALLNPFHPIDLWRIWSLLYNGKNRLISFLKENQINACLALWIIPGGYFANYAYRKAGIPYSVWSLGSDVYRYGKNPVLYPLMKRVIQEAREVFADGFDLSQKIEKRFRRRCYFLATSRTILSSRNLRNGGREGLSDKPYRFLFVGRFEKVKGVDLLLKSVEGWFEKRSDVQLTLVGKGSLEHWARSFVYRKSLEGRVFFAGNIPDEELARLYESSDCVVIPSRSESIPLVFSEALNFGKELIVTDVGDMGELGRQYGVAYVVPPEDPEALREAMERMVEDRNQKREAMDEKKKEVLKRLFNIETSVERFLKDYQ
ncbi:MAG: glycosyltransferase [Thermodesulfobacteriota bacterium]